MPRNVKDSDDEQETRSSARRTRAALNPSVLDSPLRRSSRIKHPVHQDGSSPESTSDVSSVGTSRSNRRRTTTGDSGVAETGRSLRTRRNSVASDISELTETESLPDGPPKRVTRRSIAGIAAAETPPSLNGRARRATRAGSESKSTPPVGRTTRRNRATSLEPEGIEEQKIREVGTPAKSRRRASVLPSEPALAEESEDSGRGSRRHVDKTVYEIDEDESDSGHNTSRSSRRKSRNDANESPEKMEVDESPVKGSEGNTIASSARENTEAGGNIFHTSRRLEDLSEAPRPEIGDVHNVPSSSAENQEKNPDNEEPETLNASAKSSSSDARLSGRRSLDSSLKNQEKSRSVTTDDGHETPTKLPQDSTAESPKKTEKLERKERYSVDDCVVIIEPMEIDRVDRNASVKEIPKTRRRSSDVARSKSETTAVEETDDKSSDKKQVENAESNAIIEDVADERSSLKISNVVSIADDAGDEEKKEEPERVDIVEMTEDFETEIEDTVEVVETQPLIEVPNDEKDSPEASGSIVDPEVAISEEKAPNESANDENESPEAADSNAEAEIITISEDKATKDDEEMSQESSISIVEITAPSSVETNFSDCANDEKASMEASNSIVEPPAPISEGEARGDVAKDDETSAEASNSEEKDSGDVAEESPMEFSISNAEAPASSAEEKIGGVVASDERASTESSGSIVEPPVDSASASINNERAKNSSEIEDNLVFSKGRKSSIVAESPTSGANGEEVPIVSEAAVKSRKSASNGESKSRKSASNESKTREIEEKSTREVVNENDGKSRQSDDESEYDGYPAFKDIPADEWKPNKEGETNSLHSASTERNESDCDLELVVNDVPQLRRESRDKARSDYDSDETVKDAAIAREDEENEEENSGLAASQAAPMDVSSDVEEAEIEAKSTEETPGKRASLDASRKINEKTPNKNVSRRESLRIDDCANGGSNSPAKINEKTPNKNVSRRESLRIEDSANDTSNSPSKINEKTPNKNVSRRESLRIEDSANDTSNSPSKINEKTPNKNVSRRESQRIDDTANDSSKSPTKSGDSSKRVSLNSVATVWAGETDESEWAPEYSDVSMDLVFGKIVRSQKMDLGKTTVWLADTTVKDSPASSAAARRKSLQADESANDSSGSSVKLNSSARRHSLNVSARRREEANNISDDEPEAENSDVVSSPKVAGRKSLDASAKKSKDRAANSPKIGEKKSSESPARRNRSLDKSADDVADSSDNSTESEVGKRAKAKSLHAELMKQLKGRLSTGNASDSSASPKPERNRSRIADSDGEAEIEESRDDKSTPKDRPSKSRKSASAKKSAISLNNSTYGTSSEPVIAFQDSPASPENQEPVIVKYRDSPQSPDTEDQAPVKSAKIGSSKKSLKISSAKRSARSSKSQAAAENSDTPLEDENDEESPESAEELEKSALKIGSAKKSAEIGSAKKSANNTTISLNSSGSPPDDEESADSPTKSSRSASAKKSGIERNYSTIAQINSDSELDEDVESSDDSADVSRQIPKFLYDRDSDSDEDDSSKSIDSDVARDLNLDGKSTSMLRYSDDDVPADDCVATETESSDDEDDDGVDLMDFVVADDEDVDEEEEEEDEDNYEDVADDLGDDDEESNDSSPAVEKAKPRKRIIPRPAGASDSDESDEQEEPMIVSPEKSAAKLDKTQEILEDEPKSVDLNSSVKNPAARNKNLLMQSSTPKTMARQSLLQEKANKSLKSADSPANKSLKSADSPANKSLKSTNSPAKVDQSGSRKLSKSVCETTETPAKLGSSFKLSKTPKSALTTQQQLQTSLPVDLNETAGRTNLSKAKSTKISTLNQTVVPAGSESPETRFLMKEKLNDSMPALKLQQRVRALRLSILDNLREKRDATEELHEEAAEEILEKSVEKRAEGEEKVPRESEISGEKKKKKKRRKSNKSETSNASLNPEEENVAEIAADSTEVAKNAKKLSRKKKSLASEPEEPQVEEIPKKKKKKQEAIEHEISTEPEKPKKKKKQRETMEKEVAVEAEKPKKKKKQQQATIEQDASTENEKPDKKKKKKKQQQQLKKSDDAESEVPIVSKKSRRLEAAQRKESLDSDSAPETVDFAAARDAAIRDFRKMTASIKSGQEAKRKKEKLVQENPSSRSEGKTKSRREAAENVEKTKKTSVKRLPEDVLANLSAVAERPKKRRKVAREEKPKIALTPLRSESGLFSVDEGYIPLSSAGGTTQFTVVNLKKAEKRSKKAVAAMTFRERMLARNPRQPVSAYMMYLQKQKVSGMDRQY